MKKINPDWLTFIYKRINELHPFVFSEKPHGYTWDPQTILARRMAYFAHYAELNKYGFGRDYSQHPRNPIYHP